MMKKKYWMFEEEENNTRYNERARQPVTNVTIANAKHGQSSNHRLNVHAVIKRA
jgi:hypothetical protein